MVERKSKKTIHPSFKDFYEKRVIPLKNQHPNYLYLMGETKNGGSRNTFAFFEHQGKTWNVHEDTLIERLDIAYKHFLKTGNSPFVQKRTKGDKNDCLDLIEIILPPDDNKLLYIYKKS